MVRSILALLCCDFGGRGLRVSPTGGSAFPSSCFVRFLRFSLPFASELRDSHFTGRRFDIRMLLCFPSKIIDRQLVLLTVHSTARPRASSRAGTGAQCQTQFCLFPLEQFPLPGTHQQSRIGRLSRIQIHAALSSGIPLSHIFPPRTLLCIRADASVIVNSSSCARTFCAKRGKHVCVQNCLHLSPAVPSST
jgi:hypothetical protein